jgi:sec-independent protein translocase protein TatC
MRDKQLSILGHLNEIKSRMMIPAILFAVGFILAMIFYEPLIRFLLVPAQNHLSPSAAPIVTGLTEFLGITLKMAFIAGLILAVPMFFYQLVKFISPAISPQTEMTLLAVLPTMLILFACGIGLGYFMVVPTMVRFLLDFGSDLVTPMIRLSDYLSVISMLLAGLGLAFQTPIIMFVLARIGLVSYRGFIHFWRWVVVLAFVVGAIFDPTPNPFDQLVVAGCIIILYGVGILLSWIIREKPVVVPHLVKSPT